MDRMACVDLPELPLQIALERHPDWRAFPVVVVDKDSPQGVVLWANERARRLRIRPGLRYGAGLQLSDDLRADVVSEADVAAAIDRLTQALWNFSPRIEPAALEPGVFWLDATGLLPLFPSYEEWARSLRKELAELGFTAVVAVGFSRFGTLAAAKSSGVRTLLVFESPEEERAYARRVPIDQLDFRPTLRDLLEKLGLTTLGQFVDLPGQGISRRLGPEALELYRLARGEGWERITAEPWREAPRRTLLFDHPEAEVARLLANFEVLLRSLVEQLDRNAEGVSRLRFTLELDRGPSIEESLEPAQPTRRIDTLLELIALRLEGCTLGSGVVELSLEVEGASGAVEQLGLFRESAPGEPSAVDLLAADRALARIRAEFGDRSVVRVRLRDAHLPEARFIFEPFSAFAAPEPRGVLLRPLVRRIYESPISLGGRARQEPDGWIVGRLADGPVDEIVGPEVVSGGWWVRELTRFYHYVRMRNERWLWIYYDHRRRRWYGQGEVE